VKPTTVFLAILIVLGLAACSNVASDDGSAAAQPLAVCVRGVWLRGDRACACMPGTPLMTTQCPAQDCVESGVIVLAADGTEAELTLHRSKQQGKFSAFGGALAVTKGTWSVDDKQGTLTQTTEARTWTTDATCAGDTMKRPSLGLVYVRAPAGLATAISAAVADGSWVDRSYAP